MFAQALTPSFPAPVAGLNLCPPAAASPRLRLLSLVDPPVAVEDGEPRMGGLWASESVCAEGEDRLLAKRHLALQGLLFRLESMGGLQGLSTNPALRLLVGSRLSHVHASSDDFERLVADAIFVDDEVPSTGVAYIDESRDWLVFDTERSFAGSSAQPTPALLETLARLAELPTPARRRLVRGQQAENAEAWRPLLLDTARKLARRNLGEPGIGLSARASELARQLGPAPLIQWLLSDLPMPLPVLHSERIR